MDMNISMRDKKILLMFLGVGIFAAGYFFGFVMDWGIVGIWMAFPFGLTTAGIMYYLRFRSRTLEKH